MSIRIVKFNKNNELVDITATGSEQAIRLKRGVFTQDAVNNVSELLSRLPLSKADNDRMVELMKIMLLAAEQEQFLEGFNAGIGVSENNLK